jgi:hypothetical protein
VESPDTASFIARGSSSGAAERVNYQLFLSELCDLLGVARPDPTKPDNADNAYVFESSVTFHHPDGTTSPGRIDLYKRVCYVLEAKQGVEKRGVAEALAEAWLATQRIPQAREVWPGSSPPPSIQQKLRLPLKDMGVDGIVETATDDLFCYQAKFRNGRPALTWSELSTFFGLTDSGNGQLVFTNCDDIASVAEQRPGALFVRGSDLDRLTSDDLRVIQGWISGISVPRQRKSPLPHQAEAIDDILRGFAEHTKFGRETARPICGEFRVGFDEVLDAVARANQPADSCDNL